MSGGVASPAAAAGSYPAAPGTPRVTWLLGLAVLWGVTFPVAHWGIHEGAAPFALLTEAFTLATLVGLGLAFATREARPALSSLALSAGLGALLIGSNNVLLFWGIQYATGGLASVIYATTPLIAALAARAMNPSSHLGPLGLLALLVGFAGVVLLEAEAAGTSLLSNPAAFVAILGGAASQSVGTVLVVRYRPTGEGRYGQTAQFAGAAGLSAVVVLAFSGPYTIAGTFPAFTTLLYFSLLSLVAGYAIFFRMIRGAGAVSANLVNYVIPVVALLVGIAVLGEAAAGIEGVGLGIILAGLALFELSGRRPLRQARAPPRSDRSPDAPSSPGL